MTINYSINRNIVECKDENVNFWQTLESVLIETLWNVKVYLIFIAPYCNSVLIETLWNVKLTVRSFL